MPSDCVEDGKAMIPKYKLTLPPNSETIMRGTQARIRVHPLKMALAQCTSCVGPAISQISRPVEKSVLRDKERQDVLRKVSLMHELKNHRMYWICFFDLTIYLYRAYGDVQPRFVIKMHEADVSASLAIPNAACVVFSDGRTLTFIFTTKFECSKFIFM